MTPMQHLVKTVNAEQDALLGELNLAPKVRARLLSTPPRRSPVWRWFALALPAAAAVLMVWRFYASALTYASGNSRASLPVGSWLAAPADGELPLHFSDQSTVTLSAKSHARVVELSDHQAKVLLERGRVTMTVIHHTHRKWHLRAGPFDVAVTGTRFEVAWNPEREQFEVHTVEGKVEVTGDQFAPRVVAAGETLRAERLDGNFRFMETDAPPSPQLFLSPSAAPAIPIASLTPAASSVAPSEVVAHRSSPLPVVQTWRELATTGQYKAALQQAENDGFEGLCRTLNLSDLLALSEAARFAGNLDRARLALTSIRQRFSGQPAASVATFTLGRMAFDSSRDYLGAARWFRAYLSEQPSGSLAREAAGRLVESLKRGGDQAGAKAAARAYLERYPDGPQKRVAQQVIGEY